MMKSRTPWRTKLRPEMEPQLIDAPKGRGKMLVPTPMMIVEEVRKTKRGKLTTPGEIRQRLAKRLGADVTCPMTTGIFLNIVAGATEDDIAAGRRPLAPYWRVVRDDGSLNEKSPAGVERQAEHLRDEGHLVAPSPKSRKLVVAGFEIRT